MDIKQAARNLLDLLTADGTEPASILVPAEIVEDGPEAVNKFAQAFDTLASLVDVAPVAVASPAQHDVEIDYTNHRGERRVRRIRPLKLTWGLSEWHEGSQWILLAHCYEKNQPRQFAMTGIHKWSAVTPA